MVTLPVVYDIFNNAVPFGRMKNNGLYFSKRRSNTLCGKYPKVIYNCNVYRTAFGYATVIFD